MNFKSREYPSNVVFESSGTACLLFEHKKPKGQTGKNGKREGPKGIKV
jgi:hypothetical protein